MAQEIKSYEEGREENGKEALALTALLAPFSAFVTYEPLRTEVDFRHLFSLPQTDMIYHISPRASLDPFEEARNAVALIQDAAAAILIPGRTFDAAGTRHGQGGGWYDRFLTAVPNTWLRVGFCYANQFSLTPLVRQSWDQAMDAVCVVDDAENVRMYTTVR